jgi:hypothetical protein
MSSKITGWLLLIAGILIISISMFHSYRIFTGAVPIPELFKFEAMQNKLGEDIQKQVVSGLATQQTTPGLTAPSQEEISNMLEEQIKKFIPLDSIPKVLNLMSWSILAGLLMLGGAKLSGLGIKLIKE